MKNCENCFWFHAGFRDSALDAHRPEWLTGECENHKVEQVITVEWGMLCNGKKWEEKRSVGEIKGSDMNAYIGGEIIGKMKDIHKKNNL